MFFQCYKTQFRNGDFSAYGQSLYLVIKNLSYLFIIIRVFHYLLYSYL